MSNILDKSALDSKVYNDPNSVLYRGGLKNNITSTSGKNSLNPISEEKLTNDELKLFASLSVLQFPNPYDYLKKALEKLTGLKFPELPKDERLVGDWDKMYYCWFFELLTNFSNAYWIGNSKTVFNNNSLYCTDIINSVSFNEIIKQKFFNVSDKKRSNPFEGFFGFVGADSGKKNYYSWVEWYLGSYRVYINWEKQSNNKYKIDTKITNTSSWHSATRLPKSWQDKIKKEIGFEITNLVDSAPRGETIKRKLNPTVVKTLEYLGVVIPSFGGNWSQEFNIETQW